MAETSPPSLVMSTAVNEDDHGARILVIAVLCFIASGMFMLTRLTIRWPWKALFGPDDVVCFVAMAASIVQTGVMLKAVERGLGQKVSTLDLSKVESIQQLVYGSDLIYILTLSLSKLAVALLFRRLSPSSGCTAISTMIILWGTSSILTFAIREPISHPWDVAQHVSANNTSLFVRWAAIEATGIGVDISLIMFPAYILWASWIHRSSKISILLGFALLRFPVIVLAALRIVAMSRMDWMDASITYVNPGIYGQLEMHINVMAATVPCLRIFLRGWNTGSLVLTAEDIDYGEFARHSGEGTSGKKRDAKGTVSSGGARSGGKHWEMLWKDSLHEQSAGHSESIVSSTRGNNGMTQRSGSIDSQNAIFKNVTVDVDSCEKDHSSSR